MQDDPELQEEEPQEESANNADARATLQSILNLLDTVEYDQILDALSQITEKECWYLLMKISQSVSLLSRKDERERYTQLLKFLKDVAEIINTPQSLSLYHYWQGKLDMDEDRVDAAISRYEQAIDPFPDPRERLIALHDLGMLFFRTGDLMKAEHAFQRLIDDAQNQADHRGVAHGYLGLGQIARAKENLAEARHLLQYAWQSAQQVDDPRLVAHTLTELGIVHTRSGEPLQGSEYYQKLEKFLSENADRLTEEVSNRAWSSLAANRATLAFREGRREDARKFAMEALSRQSSLSGMEQIENLVIVGDMELFLSGDEKGKQHLLTAFRLAEKMRSPSMLLLAGEELTTAYILQGYYEPAHRLCMIAIDALERLRRQVGDESNRLLYIEDKEFIYTQMVVLCLLLTQLKHKLDYQKQALVYVERARSRTLIEALGRTVRIAPPAHLPGELLQREAQLLDQLHSLETQLRTPLGEIELQQRQRAYALAQDEIDDIWRQITALAPEYAALRQGQPMTFEEVRSLLHA